MPLSAGSLPTGHLESLLMSGSEPRDCEWKRCVPLPKRTFKIRLMVYTFNSPCHVNINGPDGGYSCSLVLSWL